MSQSEIALHILRNERNSILKKSDIYVLPDFPHSSDTIRQSWLTYRQNLRDLTKTQTPTLNEDGELQNVTWPTDPNGNSGPDSILISEIN